MKKIRIVRLSVLLTILLLVSVIALQTYIDSRRIIQHLSTEGYYDNTPNQDLLNNNQVEELLKSVVFIVGDKGSGSGNVIKATEKYIYILTCYHVYEGIIAPEGVNKEIRFTRDVYEQAIRNEIEFVEGDVDIDIAVVRVPNVVTGYKVAPVAKKDLVMNEDVICIGHPLGVVNFVSRGYLGTSYYKDISIFHINVIFGNSGSAVFNMRGEIVGVVKQVIAVPWVGVVQYMGISSTRYQVQELLENIRYE